MLTDEDKLWIAKAVAEVVDRVEARLTETVAEVVDRAEARLIERMRDMQTELLKAYLPAQEQGRVRDTALEARNTAVELRVASVEGRLAEIEKKLLLNPPSA